MNRVLVIGASGNIGRAVTDYFRNKPNYQVTPTTRKSTMGCMVFDPDLHDWNILGEHDILINCAGIIRESKEDDFKKVHLDLVRTILANRNKIGNPRIIHISTLGANAQNEIPFLKTKGMGDDLLLSHPNTWILRPSIVCLPGTLLVRKFKWLVFMCKVLQNRPIMPQGFVDTRVQPVMPEDLLLTIEKIIEESPAIRSIDVVGSTDFSFKELLQMASGKANLFPIELPKKLIEPVTRNFISVWFPDLINHDQFKLLFKDNIASSDDLEQIIKQAPAETLHFWTNEFKNIQLNDLF